MGEGLVDGENEAVADNIVPDDEEDTDEDEDEDKADDEKAAESTQEMTKRELFDLAEKRGLEFSRKWNKARIQQALDEAGAAKGNEEEAEENEGIVPDDEEFVDSEEEEPAETTTPTAVSGSVGDSSEGGRPMAKEMNKEELHDLDKTVHEMQRIHEEECQRRIDLLKTNEALSRDLVGIEVEVYRYESQQVELEARKRELERLRDQLLSQTGRLTDAVNTLQPETDHLRTQAEELKEAVERLKSLRREFLSGISQINEEKRDLLGA